VKEILLLQVGRHFQFPTGQQLIVGRRDEENQRLADLAQPGDVLLKLRGIPGPLGLIRGKAEEEELRLAASILVRYSKAKERGAVDVQYGAEMENMPGRLQGTPAKDDEIDPLKF
jgi:predicted ribosome quality control (RQC) complex YloA/Tae2 family protein